MCMGEIVMMKLSEVMKRSGFVRNHSQIVLKFDLAGLRADNDVIQVMDYFLSIAKKMPKKSMVGLADFTNLNVTPNIATELIRLAEECNASFRASAVITSDTKTSDLANTVINHYKTPNIKIFHDADTANDWISRQ